MRTRMNFRFDRFWFAYFCVRIVYLLFAVYVYDSFSRLGDTARYLSIKSTAWNEFNKTSIMDSIGSFVSSLTGGNVLLSNFPFMLLSFFCVRWAIETLHLRQRMNRQLLFILLSLPNFCIWTSVCSKECMGLYFSAILGVLCVHFLQGDCRLHWRDLLGAGLCLIFKPQYLPFILQGLAFIWLADKLALTSKGQMMLGAFFIILNIGILYFIQPLVDDLSFKMYAHFDLANAGSTRDNIFLHEGDFYRQAPWGMFLSFFGPTLSEMIQKPTHLIAGMESLLIIILMLFMARESLLRLCILGRLEPRYMVSIFLIITGICFIHYPFGIFNPGSAIRYRTNFIFLFILILSELYIHDTTNEMQENSFLRQ